MQGIVDSTAPGSTPEPQATTTPGAPPLRSGAPGAEPSDAGLAAESSPDAEVCDHMFEPFFTTREKGTGLGLAFVREIVTDHGGTISCESSAEAGTRFTVRRDASILTVAVDYGS
jgi:hypothetical protein